jgi:ribosomal protein S18 acetylase RimI-like enzyme
MSTIIYETFARDEIYLVRSLWERLRLFTRDTTTHFEQYYEELDFEERIAKLDKPGTEARIDVARDERSGAIVGYSIASVNADRLGELDSFYVDERFRGRGIGEGLLERSLGWMERQDPRDCVILTAYENDAVLPLYARFGFYPRLVMLYRK